MTALAKLESDIAALRRDLMQLRWMMIAQLVLQTVAAVRILVD